MLAPPYLSAAGEAANTVASGRRWQKTDLAILKRGLNTPKLGPERSAGLQWPARIGNRTLMTEGRPKIVLDSIRLLGN
jgi:hypothetical protein